MIIGIGGKKGVGKSTLAKYLSHKLSNATITNFARPLKNLITEIVGEDVAKNTYIPEYERTVGELYQYVGTDLLRDELHANVFIHIMNQWTKRYPPNTHVILDDVRFPNEVKWIHDQGGIVILLEGPNRMPDSRNSHHKSETQTLLHDLCFTNSGTRTELVAFSASVCNKIGAKTI